MTALLHGPELQQKALEMSYTSKQLWTSPDSIVSGESGPKRPKKARKSSGSPQGSVLACISCRSKKSKCEFAPDGCQKCKKLGIVCVWPREDQRKNPSSKQQIRQLQARIKELEAALECATGQSAHRVQKPLDLIIGESDQSSGDQSMTPETTVSNFSTHVYNKSTHGNVITRLCQRQWQLNSDAEGQYKFFGPTSSPHLTESVSSSIFGSWGESSIHENTWAITDIDPETQFHLLELYWKHQHSVFQVLHKQTFLEALETRQSNYISKALLYSIFACGARYSPQPAIRALAMPSEDDTDFAEPYLLSTASKLLEEELKRPQITTIQTILILTVVYCALGQNTKGWLLTGDACRLAIDLGIHKDTLKTTSTNLSVKDRYVRQITFWGCIVVDRLWALFLGRPHCLRVDNIQTFDFNKMVLGDPWEAQTAHAWVTLLQIVGDICDALNLENCPISRLEELDGQLQSWYDNLDDSLKYHKDCPLTSTVLYTQYSSAMILLHRPMADFGTRLREQPHSRSAHSRRQCVHFAREISHFLQDYRDRHGDASTLSSTALYGIATAATTLVADIAERRPDDTSLEMSWLKICVRSLGEMKTTYFVAKKVRKIIQLIIRVCHLENEYLTSREILVTPPIPDQIEDPINGKQASSFPEFAAYDGLVDDNAFAGGGAVMDGYSPFGFDEFLPTSAQFDVFPSICQMLS